MPIKVSDFLKKIIDPIGFKNNDLEAALQASGLKEIELPDELHSKFEHFYFTKERALNDDEINRHLKKEARGMVFGSVDQKIKKLLPLISTEDATEINGTEDTIEKLELLQKAIQKVKDAGHSDETAKKASAKAREIEEQLRNENATLQAKLKETADLSAKEKKQIELNYALRSKIAMAKLAPEFESTKDFLANSTIDKLTKNFVLEFDETGSGIKLLKNVDGHLKDYYEGNTKVTLDQVIAKELEPFTVKSNGNEKQSNQKTPPAPFTPPTDKPMTLDEMRRTAAAVS